MNEMHTISSHRILNLESDRLSCSTVPSKIPCAILILFDHFFLAMKKRATALSLHRPVVERNSCKGSDANQAPRLGARSWSAVLTSTYMKPRMPREQRKSPSIKKEKTKKVDPLTQSRHLHSPLHSTPSGSLLIRSAPPTRYSYTAHTTTCPNLAISSGRSAARKLPSWGLWTPNTIFIFYILYFIFYFILF